MRNMPWAWVRPPQPLLGMRAWGSNNIPSVSLALLPYRLTLARKGLSSPPPGVRRALGQCLFSATKQLTVEVEEYEQSQPSWGCLARSKGVGGLCLLQGTWFWEVGFEVDFNLGLSTQQQLTGVQ